VNPPNDELESLAERGRPRAETRDARRAADDLARERLAASREAFVDRKTRSVATRALALGAYPLQPVFIVVASLPILPLVLMVLSGEAATITMIFGMFGGIAAIALAYVFVVIPVAGERQRRWLASLPFDFDLASYERQLAVEREHTMIALRIRFVASLAPEAIELARDVIASEAEGDRGEVDGEEITVSVIRATRFRRNTSTTGTRRYFESYPVHRWVRACIVGALLPLHARHPIAACKLSVTTTR
jgi:hypothetical protein